MKDQRWRLRILCASFAVAPLPFNSTALSQQQAAPAVDKTLIPHASTRDSVRLADGRTIHLVCMGKGSPVVILSTGGDGWSAFWSTVQPAAAAKTRVCGWDRAALGLSGPSPKPQTVDNTTTDLEAALKAGGIPGPYVLVGHSLGAYNSLLFADREPQNVAGMVLVDPSVPDMVARFARVAPANAKYSMDTPMLGLLKKCAAALRAGTVRRGGPDPDGCLRPQPRPPTYPPELLAAFPSKSDLSLETIASNMENYAAHISEKALERDSKIVIKADRNYGRMPLIVLSAGDDGSADPSSANLPADVRAEFPVELVEKQRAHEELAKLSTRGVHRIVADSSHDIPHIKPQAVVDAIDEVVREARGLERERGTR